VGGLFEWLDELFPTCRRDTELRCPLWVQLILRLPLQPLVQLLSALCKHTGSTSLLDCVQDDDIWCDVLMNDSCRRRPRSVWTDPRLEPSQGDQLCVCG
jgi:hypothetical protein